MADVAPGRDILAGRDLELAALRRCLAEALAGRGRLVVLTGPPGIGKTRLAEELADSARRAGKRVLWGRAVEERGAPPLWPWRRILAAVGGASEPDMLAGEPESAGADDLTAVRFRAAATAADALIAAANAAGLLIVLEDLHWADHASLFLLRELAAELPGSHLLALATCRDTAGDPWQAALADLARLPGLQVMRLAPLGEAAVDEILRAAGLAADPDLTRFVHARSEGNPLYVATLARVLAAQPGTAPDTDTVARIAGGSAEISHLVSSLSGGLDDGARGLLAAASVLGTEFSSELAASVSGAGQDVLAALAAAEAAGLATRRPNRPGSWRFSHALIRDGIYAGLGEDQRVRLHGRAAAALGPLARQAPERGGEVAAHLLRAAPDRTALRQAADWAVAAAAAATGALAFEDAAGYLATALAAAEAAGASGADRATLLSELATAEYRAGQLAASLQHAVAAADAAEPARRPDLLADAALVVRGIGHHQVAVTLLGLCDRALADPDCPAARRARLLAQRASALAEIGDMEAAGADSAAAMTAARAAGDPAAELDAIRARVAALSAPQHRTQWLRLGARTVELAAVTGQPIAAVLGRVWRIDACYQLMNVEAVDTEIALIAQPAESTRLPLARWQLLRQQASRAALGGQFATARDRSEQARRLAVRIQDLSGVGMSHAFALSLASLRGDAAEIRPDFFDVLGKAPPIPIIRASRAAALFATGQADEARAVYETLRQLPAAGDRDVRMLGSLIMLVDLIIAFRDTGTAQATYDLFYPLAAQGGMVGSGLVSLHGSVHWPLGRLAALLGRTEQALDHFASALTVNTRLGARPFVVVTRLDWAVTLAGRAAGDDLGQARELARQAAAEARCLDMPGPAGRAERLARELEQAIGAASPLTRREREIAGLVSDGLTNRAIADRLVLSERTVEGHVRSTLAKLQLTNRTELAAWALRDAGSLWEAGSGKAAHGVKFDAEDSGAHAWVVVHKAAGRVEVGVEDAVAGDAAVVGGGKDDREQARFDECHVASSVFPDDGVAGRTGEGCGGMQHHEGVRLGLGDSGPHRVISDGRERLGERNATERLLDRLGEAAQAPARADRVAHAFPPVAMPVEVPVGQHNPGAAGRERGEGDLDLAGALRVGLDLPLKVYVPAETDPAGSSRRHGSGQSRLGWPEVNACEGHRIPGPGRSRDGQRRPRRGGQVESGDGPGELQAGAVASSASGVGHAGPCTARMAALMGAIAHAGGRVQHWRLITLGTRAKGLAMRPTMSAELSRRVMDAAVTEAAAVAVAVVTVDESGVLKELRRMDGAPLISVQTAVSKAYAAAAIGMPPDEFYAAIESDGAAVASFATRPGLALIGGIPVVADGQVAGAVGVAGAMKAAEDRRIAEAAIGRARRQGAGH